MLDYGALLLGPVYSMMGVSATITLTDAGTTTISVTVLDKTGGVLIGANIQTGTMECGAVFRFSELDDAGFALVDLDDAEITFSDNTWRIVAHHPKPVPSGEKTGEIVLILEAA